MGVVIAVAFDKRAKDLYWMKKDRRIDRKKPLSVDERIRWLLDTQRERKACVR